jgi:hypothetical protein
LKDGFIRARPNGDIGDPLLFRNIKKRPAKIDIGNRSFLNTEERMLLGEFTKVEDAETDISTL